jgi:hypothetical protein
MAYVACQRQVIDEQSLTANLNDLVHFNTLVDLAWSSGHDLAGTSMITTGGECRVRRPPRVIHDSMSIA